MVPRIIKATVKGLLWFVILYVLYTFLISSLSKLAPSFFGHYEFLFSVYIYIFVFFVVASELTSGTIFQHAFNIGKAFVLMIFTVYALSGGIVSIYFENMDIVADLRIYLVMLLTIGVFGLAKNVLKAINFLSEKTEIDKLSSQH
jgi:hypothetical protein